MKTLYASVKILPVAFLLVVFSTITIQSTGQESVEKKKEVQIKMIKEVDGKETIIDTTFEVSSLEDLERLEDLDIIIGDELIENLGIELGELDEIGEVDVQVMSFETDGEGEAYKMFITKEIEEEMGVNGETIKTIDLIVEMADSLDNAKVITLQMDGEEHTVFVSDDEEMKTITTEDGEKTIIIKHKGDADDADIMIINGDDGNWHEKMGTNVQVEETEDGNKVIITEENGEVKEYIIKDGEGAYMIDDEGILTKVEGDQDIIWKEGGDNVWVDVESDDDGEVIIIRSKDGTDSTQDMEHNVFINKNGDGEEKEVFVNVIKKKEGDKTIVIETKVILESPDDGDKETMEKAGVTLFPESDDNKLKVGRLKFSPNPSNGKFMLKFTTPEEGNANIQIYNINGAEVYSESLKNFNGTYEKEIDISGEKSGTYFLKVTQGKNIMSRKIVIE